MSEFEIIGGTKEDRVGPVSVTTAQILALSSAQARLGASVADVGLRLGGMFASPSLITAGALDPLGSAKVRTLMMDLATGMVPGGQRTGIAGQAAGIGEHARQIAKAAGAYEFTEGRTGREFAEMRNSLRRSVEPLAPLLVGVPAFWATVVGAGLVSKVSGKPINEQFPGITELAVMALPGLLGPILGTLPTNSSVVNKLARHYEQSGYSTVVIDQRVKARPGEPVQNVTQLFEGLARSSRKGEGYEKTDSVRIDTVNQPGQPARYVVYLPPTQAWFDANRPANGLTNLQAAADRDSAGARLALQAMEREGIPAGAEVMFVGYSQGGLVGVQLARSAAVRDKYRIRGVATIGSPVEEHLKNLPESTSALNIEHDDDPVAMGDGHRNPTSDTHVTVRAKAPDLNGPEKNSVMDAHSYEAYMATVKSLDAADQAAVRGFTEQMSDFMGGPGTTVTWSEYTGVVE